MTEPAVPAHITLAANAVEADLIEQFEGFLPTAKWDVNAYRCGYGSDTEGPEQRKVTKGMTTTRERAFANLEARMPQFEAVIVKQVGAAEWDKLPTEAKAALLSMGYNYGDLPDNVAAEVKTGASLALIAAAVLSHAGDNKGVNAKRRAIEAQDIRTAGVVAAPTEPASQVAELTIAAAPNADPAAKPIDVHTFAGIQEALNVLVPSTPPIKVDNSYGPDSVAKMKAFQASEKLKETGDTSFYSVLAVYQALQKAGVPTVNPA
jgi:GH24 family phage-related lysozyme (muramidase)